MLREICAEVLGSAPLGLLLIWLWSRVAQAEHRAARAEARAHDADNCLHVVRGDLDRLWAALNVHPFRDRG